VRKPNTGNSEDSVTERNPIEDEEARGSLSRRFRQQYGMEEGMEVLRPDSPMPRNMMVELSNACNHACIFCTSPHMSRKIGRIESGLLHRIMMEARTDGVEEIGFYTTGEPFIHKELDKFTAEASTLGYRYIYISTNGALATPERARKVIDAGMNSIKFSINAGSRETYKLIHGHDDWDKVMANLRFISEYRKTLDRPLKLFVTFIVTNQTAHEVESFRERIEPLVDEVVFHKVHNQSGQMNAAEEILSPNPGGESFKSDAVCKMPFNRLHVSCEGFLTLCCVDYQNYLAVADLKEMSLREAWNAPLFQDMRRRHLERDLAGTLCGNCWLGRRDRIVPLRDDLASPVDFPGFYREVSDATENRLAHMDDAAVQLVHKAGGQF